MTRRRYILGLNLATVLVCLFSPDQARCDEAGASRPMYQVVSRQEILDAMRQAGDYDPTATTNGARFQWEVIFNLAHRAWERDPRGAPLFIDSEDWFQSFMETTGRTEDEMPLYARLAYEYKQHMEGGIQNGSSDPQGDRRAGAPIGIECPYLVGRPDGQRGSLLIPGYAVDAHPQDYDSSVDFIPAAGSRRLVRLR